MKALRAAKCLSKWTDLAVGEEDLSDSQHQPPSVVPPVLGQRPGGRIDVSRLVAEFALLEEGVRIEHRLDNLSRAERDEAGLHVGQERQQSPECRT